MINKKKERAEYIRSELARLYPHPKAPLNHKDHYTLLVAVLLSAQCTDERVNKITPALFELADTPLKMSSQKLSDIKKIIRPCGLSDKKSSAILELSKIITKQHKGKVPNNFTDLEKLPGVGHKTASVVMTQAFNKPAFPVDTHILRLANRWRLAESKNVNHVERDLKEIFEKETWGDIHLQIIFYGREYCSARGCDGFSCPICKKINT